VRDDFRRAHETPSPSAAAYDVARGLASLEAAIAAAPAPAAPAGAPGGTAAAKSLAAVLGKGAFWGLVAVGAAAVAWIRLGDRGAAAPPASIVSVASASPATVESAAPPLDPSAPPAPPVPPASAETAEPPAPAARPAARRPAAAPAEDGLHQEVEHLARVRSLVASNPAEALAMAEEGHRRFRGGVLRQEREALAIDALGRLGRRGEAQVRARAFLAAYPRSPLAEHFESVAGEGG
jgi:hypothetical protein